MTRREEIIKVMTSSHSVCTVDIAICDQYEYCEECKAARIEALFAPTDTSGAWEENARIMKAFDGLITELNTEISKATERAEKGNNHGLR